MSTETLFLKHKWKRETWIKQDPVSTIQAWPIIPNSWSGLVLSGKGYHPWMWYQCLWVTKFCAKFVCQYPQIFHSFTVYVKGTSPIVTSLTALNFLLRQLQQSVLIFSRWLVSFFKDDLFPIVKDILLCTTPTAACICAMASTMFQFLSVSEKDFVKSS